MQAQLAHPLHIAYSADEEDHDLAEPAGAEVKTDRADAEMRAIQQAIARVEAEAKAACAAESRAGRSRDGLASSRVRPGWACACQSSASGACGAERSLGAPWAGRVARAALASRTVSEMS